MEKFREKIDAIDKKLERGVIDGSYNIHHWLDDYYAAFIERIK